MLEVPCWEFEKCLEVLKETFNRTDLPRSTQLREGRREQQIALTSCFKEWKSRREVKDSIVAKTWKRLCEDVESIRQLSKAISGCSIWECRLTAASRSGLSD
jgi:hypothetical protein